MMKYIFQVVQLKIHRDAFEHPVVRVQCVISNCLVFLCDFFLYMQEIPPIGSPKSNQIIKNRIAINLHTFKGPKKKFTQ